MLKITESEFIEKVKDKEIYTYGLKPDRLLTEAEVKILNRWNPKPKPPHMEQEYSHPRIPKDFDIVSIEKNLIKVNVREYHKNKMDKVIETVNRFLELSDEKN